MCIRRFLLDRAVRFDYLLHRPAATAAHLAGSIHMPGRSVAKSVLVHASGSFVLAVLPATHRIDTERLSRVLDAADLRIASQAEVEAVFHDCEPGALPPLGRLYGIATVVDSRLAAGPDIAFVGNMRHEGIRMRYCDYQAIEAPIRARFAVAAMPTRARVDRKAG